MAPLHCSNVDIYYSDKMVGRLDDYKKQDLIK